MARVLDGRSVRVTRESHLLFFRAVLRGSAADGDGRHIGKRSAHGCGVARNNATCNPCRR